MSAMRDFVGNPDIDNLDTESQKHFLDYWKNLKGSSEAPRQDIFDVLDLTEYAANLTILSVDEVSGQFVCKLSGCELIELWGADFTGVTISKLKGAEGLMERIEWVVQHKTPYFYSGKAPWAPKDYRVYSVVGLPFMNEAGNVVMIVTLTVFPRDIPQAV